MIRFIILLILGYLLYRALKGIFGGSRKVQKGVTPNGVIDEMVQDPFCKTYVPMRESVKKTIGGQRFFFCSQECADRFESEMKE